MYRRAEVVAYGAGIALGMNSPPDEYWESIADGKGEALLAKAQYESKRRSE